MVLQLQGTVANQANNIGAVSSSDCSVAAYCSLHCRTAYCCMPDVTCSMLHVTQHVSEVRSSALHALATAQGALAMVTCSAWLT